MLKYLALHFNNIGRDRTFNISIALYIGKSLLLIWFVKIIDVAVGVILYGVIFMVEEPINIDIKKCAKICV